MSVSHTNPRKLALIQLIDRWLARASLSFSQLVAHLQLKGVDMSEGALGDRLKNRPERAPSVSPDLALAVIEIFRTLTWPEEQKCSAPEALQFADLADLSVRHTLKIGQYFPAEEFAQAFHLHMAGIPSDRLIGAYVGQILRIIPKVKHSCGEGQFLRKAKPGLPLLKNDKLYVEKSAKAVYICWENNALFRISERSLATVECDDSDEKFFVDYLDNLIDESNADNDEPLNVDAVAVDQNLGKEEKTQIRVILHHHWRQWLKVIEYLRESKLNAKEGTSSYFNLLLGDAYLATGRYDQAKESYLATRTDDDSYIDGIALLSLARFCYVQYENHQAEQYLQQITDQALIESAVLIRRVFKLKTEPADASRTSSITTLHDFVKSVAADLDVQLAGAIETISDSFMDRLGNLIGSDLALPEPQLLDVNNQPMVARQRVSLTYLATIALQAELIATGTATLDADSITDLVARVTIERGHLDEESARKFAVQYAARVTPNLDMLQQLK